MKRRLSVTNLSSENNSLLLDSHDSQEVHHYFFTFTLMTTGAFSGNVGKLFSKLKLVTNNLLIYAEGTEKLQHCSNELSDKSSCNHQGFADNKSQTPLEAI